jgi:hypothetical protein
MIWNRRLNNNAVDLSIDTTHRIAAASIENWHILWEQKSIYHHFQSDVYKTESTIKEKKQESKDHHKWQYLGMNG